MDQRVLFIGDYLRGARRSFTDLCRCYNISRKTGYKWLERYRQQGAEGLHEQSRKPHTHPQAIPFSVREAIIECRTKGRIKLGPKKIQQKLFEQFPNTAPPSITSIHNILKREGLIKPRRCRQRVSPYREPFAAVSTANNVWSVDFKGQFKLRNGQWCYPLTIMDHHSRFLLACEGLAGTGTLDTKAAFERAFKEFGLPDRIRSDNGVPFASKAAGGLSTLSVWWIRLGIHPERIQPGKPQQNGRHERMHRTLKQVVTRPPSATMGAQQRQMNAFLREYNEERPHESLAQQVPQAIYTASTKAFPKKLPPITYPDYFCVYKVRPSGVIYWGGGQVYVSHLLQGEHVGMEEIDDGIWDVYFGSVRLGGFDQRKVSNDVHSYWSIKV